MFTRFLLRFGGDEVEIVSRDHLVEFYNEDLVVAFLRRYLREGANRAEMRRAVGELRSSDLSRLDDETLLRELARRVVSRDLKIIRRRRVEWVTPEAEPSQGAAAMTPRQAEAAAKAEKPAPPPPAPAAPVPASEPPSAESPPTLPEDVDPAAQAAVLQAASAAGTAMCET